MGKAGRSFRGVRSGFSFGGGTVVKSVGVRQRNVGSLLPKDEKSRAGKGGR